MTTSTQSSTNKPSGIRSRLCAAVLLSRGTSKSLGKNTAWAIAGFVTRLLLQAVYFVVIARCLGVKEYGGFIAVAAMASMVAPLVSLGNGSLLVKNVSRDKTLFGECWGNCLLMTIVSGSALVLAAIALSTICLPRSISLPAILLICTADLIFVRLLDMAAFAFLAFENLGMNARLNVLISANRLMGVIGLAVFVRKPTVFAWSMVYFATAVLSASVALTWVRARLGPASLRVSRIRSEYKEGIYFAINNSAATSNNDIDKAMVATLSTLEATGIYGAAYRLLDVAFIPVRALLNAAYPGFFRNGANGLRGALQYGRPLFRRALPYALVAMVMLFFGGPVVPHVLGPGYSGVAEALRWLAPLPLLKTLQFFVADSLTGSGYQRCRTVIQSFVAVFNVLINLWAIPAYGWRGAAATSLFSDGLLAAAFWAVAYHLSKAASQQEDSLVLTAGASA
ncbi:MAG: oligosaccharide flippase family protein [Candidatus Acidiferrum sp.]